MNKAVQWIIRIVIALVVITMLVIEVYPRVLNKSKKTQVDGSQNWMSKIDGEMLLSQISIPGAHDAATRNVQMAIMTKCQDVDIERLLNDGYRYLDIRLGIGKDRDEQILQFYHGPAHCMNGILPLGSKLELQQVIDTCTEFLQNNPSETILFVVKQEHGDESKAEFAKVLNKYTTGDRWLLTDEIPTLDEARGKIVLFRRYQDTANLGKEAGIYLNWSQQNNRDDTKKTIEKVKCDGTYLSVQDRFKYDTGDKWDAFVKTLKETTKLIDENNVVINFLSTSGNGAVGNPYKYAKELNKQFLALNMDVDYGWVILDYCNADLAEHVYQQNFR